MSENHPAQIGRPLCTKASHGSFGGLLVFPVFLSGLGSGLFDSDPAYTLRVIQSIGILLPLFAGLLRFTTNDQSEVSEQVNDYLLLGILGLVFGGVFAALAGMMSDVTGILKISLFFVFLTFTVIGVAAIDMLSSMVRETQTGINPEATDYAAEQSVKRADVLRAIPSESTNRKHYDDRDVILKDESESQRRPE